MPKGILKVIVERLTNAGRMATAGLELARVAEETGTWDTLNDLENLRIPDRFK
ncbi:MAG: hypothetical protein AAF600_08635 [Bacteroidota bacterium]